MRGKEDGRLNNNFLLFSLPRKGQKQIPPPVLPSGQEERKKEVMRMARGYVFFDSKKPFCGECAAERREYLEEYRVQLLESGQDPEGIHPYPNPVEVPPGTKCAGCGREIK